MPKSLRCVAVCALLACATVPPDPSSDPLTATYAPALGVDLSRATRLGNGMYIHEVRVGDGATAQRRSEVSVHYTLFLPDGKEVQTSRNAQPMLTRLNDPQFMIRDAVVGMRVGGRRTIVVPPEVGYGSAGVPGHVPPNMTLVFDVELMEVRQ